MHKIQNHFCIDKNGLSSFYGKKNGAFRSDLGARKKHKRKARVIQIQFNHVQPSYMAVTRGTWKRYSFAGAEQLFSCRTAPVCCELNLRASGGCLQEVSSLNPSVSL